MPWREVDVVVVVVPIVVLVARSHRVVCNDLVVHATRVWKEKALVIVANNSSMFDVLRNNRGTQRELILGRLIFILNVSTGFRCYFLDR